jgi:hypothetical protein
MRQARVRGPSSSQNVQYQYRYISKSSAWVCRKCVQKTIVDQESDSIIFIIIPLIILALIFIFAPINEWYVVGAMIILAVIFLYGLVRFINADSEIGSRIAIKSNQSKYKGLKLLTPSEWSKQGHR